MQDTDSIIHRVSKKIFATNKLPEDFKRSEGEEIMAEFFDEEDISYIEQRKLVLQNDTKSFRTADFYLPSYKVYVEFMGKWNDVHCREEYKRKIMKYKENNIPCIYFFPDNLGTLTFLFKRRIKRVMKEHRLTYQLFKFNLKEYSKNNLIGVLFFIGMIFIAKKEFITLFGISIFYSWFFIIIFLFYLLKTIKKEFLS